MQFNFDICIIGGVGHIGLPLGLAFANKNKKVILYDVHKKNIELVKNKKMPFIEYGAEKILRNKFKNLEITSDPNFISKAKFIIICIGTPVSSNLKPKTKPFLDFFNFYKKFKKKKQILIIRSSVYPGVCDKVRKILNYSNDISYCPERIVQGLAIYELPKLTQIISGYSKNSIKESSKLFKEICKDVIQSSVKEAELIKLFSNAYRYVNFSIANQFYMMCKNLNLDYKNVREKMMIGYYRNSNIPKAGFTAGPCLLKDTIQLSHFFQNKFELAKSAMKINEGLPKFIIDDLAKNYKIKNKTLGILGLTFKSDTDDTRDSLSLKLIDYCKKKKLKYLVSDEFCSFKNNISTKELIKNSDIIIVATPHKKYSNLNIPKKKILVDIWNIIKVNN